MEKLVNFDKKNEFWSENFEGLNLSGKEIYLKEFDDCTFRRCDFSEATFKHSNFVDCDFINCNLSLLKMEYSKFSDVSFLESKLIGINWTKVDWPSLVFSSPLKFYKSNLSDCSFYGLSLQELILDECKAHNVDFREGNFSKACFSYTDFSGSFFGNTNLSGADFSEATDYDINIYQNVINKAKFTRFEASRLLDCLDIELID